jgi:diaminobutyrate acetyltransferase
MPRSEDGPAITALIGNCPPLDSNSAYCNLLQCTHFAQTCVVAERDGEIVGWISAYRTPSGPTELFVWQVAVDASARGLGLGRRMLDNFMARPAVKDVDSLITTITDERGVMGAVRILRAASRGCSQQATVPQLATISATFPAMFPTRVRFAGFAIAYNVSTSLFGGTAPVVNAWLIGATGSTLVPAYFMMGACVVGGIALLFVVETAGHSLRGTEIPGPRESAREISRLDAGAVLPPPSCQ